MILKNAKYYTNIDECPIIVYDKVQNTQNVKILAYKGKGRLSTCLKYWTNINNEILHEFGLNPSYRHILQLKQEYAQYLANYAVKNDLSAKPMAEYTLKIIQKESEKMGYKENIGRVCSKLSKANGFIIDPKHVSVRMFFSMLSE